MRFYQLALRYLWRKKAKTFLLFLVLVLVNTMILSISMIRRAASESMDSMQAKTNSKVAAEITDTGNRITEAEVRQIETMQNVTSVNRVGQYDAFPSNFMPVTGSTSSEEENSKAVLLSYDDLEKDSPFADLQYKLTAGEYIRQDKKGAVIHVSLADLNGLKIGDTLELDAGSGRTVSVPVIGFFRSSGNTEEKQPAQTTAVNRMENQIFIDQRTCSELFGDTEFYKLVVYTDHPEKISALASDIQKVLGNHAEVSTSDTLYRQMSAPLEQVSRVSALILAFTLAAGTIVAALLLCMWMRTRQKEMAIFMSLGKTKGEIVLQVFCEAGIVFFLSVFVSALIGGSVPAVLQSMIYRSGISNTDLTVLLGIKDIGALVCMGGIVVSAALCVSIFPALKADPKDILANMEG